MTQFFGDLNTAEVQSLYADDNGGGNFVALKMHKDSQKIKKPPVCPSHAHSTPYRKPVIIHTYSPKVIQAEAHNFMQLVQKLTGWNAAEKKRKRKNKNKVPEGEDSKILTSSLNNSVSSMSVKKASAEIHLDDRRSLGNNRRLPNFRHNCIEDNVNNVKLCTPEYFMPDNTYASSQNAISSLDLVSQAPLFNNPPNILASSQNFRFPCKQQQQQGPLQPFNYVSDGVYLNPCQEIPFFMDNLSASASPAIGEYNFSEFMTPAFPKAEFDYQNEICSFHSTSRIQ